MVTKKTPDLRVTKKYPELRVEQYDTGARCWFGADTGYLSYTDTGLQDCTLESLRLEVMYLQDQVEDLKRLITGGGNGKS